MDMVAKHAGMTKRTIYKYFPDKRTLFFEVINESIGEPHLSIRPLDKILNSEDFYEALFIIARWLNNTYADPRYLSLLRIVVTEVDKQQELMGIIENGITRRAFETLTPLFRHANTIDIVHIAHPEMIAKSFIGGLLYDFYVDGLLTINPGSVQRYSGRELMNYINAIITLPVKKYEGSTQ